MNPSKQPYPSRLLACLLRIVGLAGILAEAQAAPLSISQTFHQNWVKIFQNSETVQSDALSKTDGMREPRTYPFQINNGGTITKKILMTWMTQADTNQHPIYTTWTGSTNGGVTWNAPTPPASAGTAPDLTGVAKLVTAKGTLAAGTLVAIPFYPNPDGTNTTSFSFPYHTSTNNGVTWTKSTNGVIDFGAQMMEGGHAFRFARGIIQDNDGTLYTTAYVTFVSGENHRVALMRSTNGGATWNYRTIIHYAAKPAADCNEATLARCANGTLLAVIRQEASSLKYSRSTNNGVNWTSPAVLPGLPANVGKDPILWMMTNGILALSYGHHRDFVYPDPDERDCHLAFSPDGNGTSWSTDLTTFTGVKTVWQGNTTGYTSIVPLGAHRLMQISDRGEKTYYYNSSLHSPNPFSIWTKIVDITPNHRNRIDLQGKYAAIGSSMISGDLTATNAAFPEAGPTGAFDGSTYYWSGAFKNAASGTYTIDLQETHLLNAIGVCLKYDATQSATIAISTDGSAWATKKTYTGTATDGTHRALDYTSFTAAPARYVRVTVAGGSPVFLNEIELYSAADTFENNAQYLPPLGYTALNGGFTVTGGAGYGYQSERTLYMNDDDTTNKTITRPTTGTATATKTLNFWVKPIAYASTNGAIQFHLTSAGSPVFHLAMFSNKSINYYTGSGWVQIAPPDTIPTGAWTRIRVEANATTGNAPVYLNGNSTPVGTAVKRGTATTMNGLLFGSGGGNAAGDQAFFDDVYFN